VLTILLSITDTSHVSEVLNSTLNMDFYYLPGSAPCRSVLMAAKAVGVELNLKVLNLMAGEHLKPEFIKVNILY